MDGAIDNVEHWGRRCQRASGGGSDEKPGNVLGTGSVRARAHLRLSRGVRRGGVDGSGWDRAAGEFAKLYGSLFLKRFYA